MKAIRNYALVTLLSATILLLNTFTSASFAEPIKWKVLASWNVESIGTRAFLVPWVERINETLKGKLHINWVGPEAVPPFEQLRPVKKGVFNVLFTAPAYHASQIAVGMGMNLFTASSKERREAGLYKLLDEAYRQRHNLHFLGIGCDWAGLHLMLKERCIDKADLIGLKIRSNPFYDPLIQTLNGATVKIKGGEIYSALEKGVVDGACWPAFGAKDFKWYEVVKYQVRPRFGETVYFFLVNLDDWNKLPKDLQKKITEITMEIEEEGRQAHISAWEKEEKELVQLGMNLCVLPPKEAKKFLDVFYDKTWSYVLKLDPEYGPRLKKAVDERIKHSKK